MRTDLSSKTALVVDGGLFLPFVHRLARDFGKVLLYVPGGSPFPTINDAVIGDGFDDIERVHDLWQAVRKSDIVVFPDVGQSDLQLQIEQESALSAPVWGSRDGDRLELERAFLKDKQAEWQMAVPDYSLVKGLTDLRDYLRSHQDVYVKLSRYRGAMETHHSVDYDTSLPWLDGMAVKLGPIQEFVTFIVEDSLDAVSELGFDSFSVDGQFPKVVVEGVETKDRGYVGCVRDYSDLPEQLRSVNEKLSPFLAEHHYRNFFSTEVRVTKFGTACLTDPCCFSEDTEILTDQGWKLFPDLKPSDQVCTLNPQTNEIEYHCPYRYVAYPFENEMIQITSPKRVLDLLVTPNHSLWIEDSKCQSGMLEEVRADSANGSHGIPRTGNWSGHLVSNFIVIPEYMSAWKSGLDMNISRSHVDKAKFLHIELVLKFMAMFLAEGNCERWVVNIAQTKYKDRFREVISALPFKWSEHPKGFRIFSVQLANFLKDIPDRSKRGIPGWIKCLPPGLINLFLDWYCLSDGQLVHKNRCCSTTSKLTADDLQELFLKAGSVADIVVKSKAGSPVKISDGNYFTKHDALLVTERKTFQRFYFEGWGRARHDRYLKKVPYSGWVYDVEVKNHIIYVRRNGKPCWSGNCRHASPAGECLDELYSNLGEIIWEGAQGNLVEPLYSARFAVQALIDHPGDENAWRVVDIPTEVRQWVKLYFACESQGKICLPPFPWSHSTIGSVIGLGDSIESAIEDMKAHASALDGQGLVIHTHAVADVLREIREAEKAGVEITDQPVPEPSIVLENA